MKNSTSGSFLLSRERSPRKKKKRKLIRGGLTNFQFTKRECDRRMGRIPFNWRTIFEIDKVTGILTKKCTWSGITFIFLISTYSGTVASFGSPKCISRSVSKRKGRVSSKIKSTNQNSPFFSRSYTTQKWNFPKSTTCPFSRRRWFPAETHQRPPLSRVTLRYRSPIGHPPGVPSTVKPRYLGTSTPRQPSHRMWVPSMPMH